MKLEAKEREGERKGGDSERGGGGNGDLKKNIRLFFFSFFCMVKRWVGECSKEGTDGLV